MQQTRSRAWLAVGGALLSLLMVLTMAQAAFADGKTSQYGSYSGYSGQVASNVAVQSAYVEVPSHYEGAYRSDPDYTGDTIKLAVDYVLPADADGNAISGQYPVIWQFSRGGRYVAGSRDSLLADYLVEHGYAYAIVELRGCGASEGVNNSFASIENRLDCKYVMENWANQQPWSNGINGSFGGSNKGLIQSAVATTQPKGYLAMSPSVSSIDFYNQDYINGVSACPVGMKLSGTGTSTEALSYEDWLAWDRKAVPVSTSDEDLKTAYNAYVYQTQHNRGFSTYMLLPNMLRDETNPYMYDEPINLTIPPIEKIDKIIESGIKQHNYAGYSDSNVALELASTNTTGGSIIIGDGTHQQVSGPTSLADDGSFDTQAVYQDRLRFFDATLKGIDNGYDENPRYYYYVENAAEGQRWRYADEYPSMDNVTRTNLYLAQDTDETYALSDAVKLSGEQSNNGKLTATAPAEGSTDSYKVVDVAVPDGYSSFGPASKGDLKDVYDSKAFTYTTAPVTEPTTLAGIATADWWVSSDNTDDADFISFIEVVNADGSSEMLGTGQIRASHRATDANKVWDSTEGLAGRHHPSMTADVTAALAEGLSQPTLLQFDYDVANYQLQPGQSLRFSTVCMMSGMFQDQPYYALDADGNAQYDSDGHVIYKDAADLPTIKVYTGGEHASFVTVPIAADEDNTYNGTVTYASGASCPGTMYLLGDNWYLYANGDWTKIAADSDEADYTLDASGAATFPKLGFTFQPEGEGPIANGIRQNYTGGAEGTYSFRDNGTAPLPDDPDAPAIRYTVANTSNSYYAETLDAFTYQEGTDYSDPANDPATNLINTKLYLDAQGSGNVVVTAPADSAYPGTLSWIAPDEGTASVKLATAYGAGVSDTSAATFTSPAMFAMYRLQYLVGYPTADLVVSSAAGGEVTVVLEDAAADGTVKVVATGTATVPAGASNAAVHVDLAQAYENRADGSTYTAYYFGSDSLRVAVYGSGVDATLALGENGSSVTLPFVDNVDNVWNGKVTVDGQTYNGTLYRFGKNTYVNYTVDRQNDNWVNFPTSTSYTINDDNSATFKAPGGDITFLTEGNSIRNGQAQSYAGGAANALPFPTFYYLDTVPVTPVNNNLLMPGHKVLRGTVYATKATREAGNAPTFIYVHGYNGAPANVDAYAAGKAAEGYAVVGMDLRNTPSNFAPDFYYDIKGNIRHLRANAASYGLDPDSFVIYGQSLGGSSALVATVSGDDPDLEGTVGGNVGVSSRVQGGIVGYGYGDLLNFGLDQRTDQAGDPESLLATMTSGGDGEGAPCAEEIDWYGPGKGLLMLRNYLAQYEAYQADGTNGSLDNTEGEAYTFATNGEGKLTYTFTIDDAYVAKWFPDTASGLFELASVATPGTYTYTVDELNAALDRTYAASSLYHIDAGSSAIMTYGGFGGRQNITNNQTTRTMHAYHDVDATAYEASNTRANDAGFAYGTRPEMRTTFSEFLDSYIKGDNADTKIVLYAADSATRQYNVVGNYISHTSTFAPVVEKDDTAYVSLEVLHDLIGTSTAQAGSVTIDGHAYLDVNSLNKVTGCTAKYFAAQEKGSYIPRYSADGKVLSESERLAASYGIVTLTNTSKNLLTGTSQTNAGTSDAAAQTAARTTDGYQPVDTWDNDGVLVNTTENGPRYYLDVKQADGSDSWRYSETFPTDESNPTALYLTSAEGMTIGGTDNTGALYGAKPEKDGSYKGASFSFTAPVNMSTSGSNLELIGFAASDLYLTGDGLTSLTVTINLLDANGNATAVVSQTAAANLSSTPAAVHIDFAKALAQAYKANSSYFNVQVSANKDVTLLTGGDTASSITLPSTERNYNVYNGTLTQNGTRTFATMYLFDDAYYLYCNNTWTKLSPDVAYTVSYPTDLTADGSAVSVADFGSFTFEPEFLATNGQAWDYAGVNARGQKVVRGAAAFPNANRQVVASVPVQPLTDGLYLPLSKTLYTNVYNPAGVDNAPLIITIHGYGGDITGLDTFAIRQLSRGYAVAGVDLRAYAPNFAPDWYQDVCGDIRYLRANADRFNLNPDKFAVYGRSLGGNSSLGAALGAGTELEGAVGGNTEVSSRVQAGVIGFGWTDLLNFGLDQRSDNNYTTDLLGRMVTGGDGETAPAASAVDWYGPGKGMLMLRNFTYQYAKYLADGTNGSLSNTEGEAYQFTTNGSGQLFYTFIIDEAYRTKWFDYPQLGGFGGSTYLTPGTYTYTVDELLAALDRVVGASPISYVSPDDPPLALYGGFGGTQNITNNQSTRTFQALQNNGVISYMWSNTQGNYGTTPVVRAGLERYLDNYLKGDVPGLKIALTADSHEAAVNYVGRNIDTPLLVQNDTAYIPVGYVAQIAGLDADAVSGTTTIDGARYLSFDAFNADGAFKDAGLAAKWYPDSKVVTILSGNSPAVSDPDPVESFDVVVGGVRATSQNYGDVLGDGTVSYDPETRTLTLSGYQGVGAIASSADALTVNLVGSSQTSGLTATGNVAFTGDGTLTVSGQVAVAGSLDITSGAVSAKTANGSAITAQAISATGGSLSGTSANGECGIHAHDGITIDGATVTGEGVLYGIHAASGSVTVNNGTVTAVGDDKTGTGIAAQTAVNVNGGWVNATGGALGVSPAATVGSGARVTSSAEPGVFTSMPSASRVTRLAGQTSDDTAAAIAARAFEGEKASTVLIARDDTYYDALSAAGLAGALNAPILLTSSDSLSDACRTAIASSGASSAVIVGGTSAVSDQVAAQLINLGLSVKRVWGDDVYATSMACTRACLEAGGSSEYAVVSSPASFYDAVSISGWAYANKVPVMLQTWGDSADARGFDSEALSILAGRKVIVTGGELAVSSSSLTGIDQSGITRLGGTDAYDTSLKIAEWELEHGMSAANVSIASAIQQYNGVDALAASALAGKKGGVVLLAQSNPVYEPAQSTDMALKFVSDHASEVRTVHVLGGAVANTQEFYEQIEAALGE